MLSLTFWYFWRRKEARVCVFNAGDKTMPHSDGSLHVYSPFREDYPLQLRTGRLKPFHMRYFSSYEDMEAYVEELKAGVLREKKNREEFTAQKK